MNQGSGAEGMRGIGLVGGCERAFSGCNYPDIKVFVRDVICVTHRSYVRISVE